MNIISYNLNINQNRSINSPLNSNKPVSSGVSFCAGPNVDVFNPCYKTAMKKLSDFSIMDYLGLSEAEKNVLREAYGKLEPLIIPECFSRDMKCQAPEGMNKHIEIFHDEFAESLKKKFDSEYRRDGYGVIVVGRSLSSIGKVLGYKIGEDRVKNIPMSDAKVYLDDNWLKKTQECGHIDKFRMYLDSIGLRKNEIEESWRKYIILDYCYTGKSLAGATKLLTRDDVLGRKNIVSEDAVKCISDKDLKERAEGYFFNCELKQFSFVGKAPWLDSASQLVFNPQQQPEKAKLLWFKLLDNEMIKQEEERNKPVPFLVRLLSKMF